MRFLLAVASFSLVACASPSKTEEFCARAESCNVLDGSEQECVEDLDSVLDGLTPSKREELLYDVERCLDRPSCDGFRTCISNLRTADGVRDGDAVSTHDLDRAAE